VITHWSVVSTTRPGQSYCWAGRRWCPDRSGRQHDGTIDNPGVARGYERISACVSLTSVALTQQLIFVEPQFIFDFQLDGCMPSDNVGP